MVESWTRFLAAMVVGLAAVGASSSAHAHVVRRVCLLTGSQETPPVASPAVGCGVFVIDTAANTAQFHIVVGGLLAAETAAHIHGPGAPGVAAGVIFPLPPGPVKTGVWNYPQALEGALLGGDLYVNVHTGAFPGGEVRGQIVTHVAILDGAQETPPVPTGASGFGLFMQDLDTNTLRYYIAFGGLGSPEVAAHIHGMALHGTAAGVLVGLPGGSPKVGAWTYPEAMEQDILDGRTYVNIHTANFGGGEIRGQIVHYVNPLDGLQETPPNGSPAVGYALVALDRAADSLSFDINRSPFGTAEAAAHIHGFAPPGVAAGVLVGLPAGVRKLGSWAYGAANEPNVLAGLTYVNIHTAAFPGGEIRGQLTFNQLTCRADWNKDGVLTPADVAAFVNDWAASLANGNLNGDYNGDLAVTPADVATFVSDWFAALGGLC